MVSSQHENATATGMWSALKECMRRSAAHWLQGIVKTTECRLKVEVEEVWRSPPTSQRYPEAALSLISWRISAPTAREGEALSRLINRSLFEMTRSIWSHRCVLALEISTFFSLPSAGSYLPLPSLCSDQDSMTRLVDCRRRSEVD